MTGTLYKDQNIFLSHLAQFFLGQEISQTKVVEKIKNTHFIFYMIFENCTVHEIVWKNILEPDTCIERWIHKAKNTHSEYLLFIVFLLQQQLHERASLLRYTYSALPDFF